ncbi:MAG: flagellar export chaperone FlgN [Synergistaceae bacterium]|nr:flagellar export chaperone FlgN [Synergistaceae bacterium]
MRPEVEELIDAVAGEADCIDDLIDAIREQRAAMSERDIDSVNALMDETRDIFFDAQTEENRRSDLAKKLAAKFSCEPTAGSLAAKMHKDERALFDGAADRLTQSIFVLKSEMFILNGLIDQNEKYTSMLLSEFQRLNGNKVSQAGSADFRG